MVVPLEERSSRYTNRQHHVPQSQGKDQESSVVRSFQPPSQEFNQSQMSHASAEMEDDLLEGQDQSMSQAGVSTQSKRAPLNLKLDLAKVRGQQA